MKCLKWLIKYPARKSKYSPTQTSVDLDSNFGMTLPCVYDVFPEKTNFHLLLNDKWTFRAEFGISTSRN